MKPKTPEEIKATTDMASAVNAQTTAEGTKPFATSSYNTKPITPEQLQPSSPVDFGTFKQEPAPTLTAIDTAINEGGKLGPTEQGAQSLAEQMLALTGTVSGKEGYRAEQEQIAGLGALEATQRDLTAQFNALVNEAQAVPLQLQEELRTRPGVSVRGATDVEQQARQRQTAIKALAVNSLLQSTQGNIANARATADRAVQLKFADDEAKLNYLTKAYDIITKSPQYTAEQKKRANEQSMLLEDRKRLLDNKKEDEKTIMAMANLAIRNNPNDQGAIMAAQQAIESGDLKKAFSLLGQYQDNPEEIKKSILESEYMMAQIDKLNADVRKINAENAGAGVPAITNPNASQYSGALQVILGSNKFTKDQKASLIQSVNSGEDPVAVLKNQAKQTMTGANQTKIESYETAQSSLKDIASDLDTFYANGGETGIFKGNYEKVVNKLGEVSDPKLVELATRIQQNLQIYRNAVSGTAYSVQEGNDIASIFPAVTKGQMLNNSVIKGRMQAFEDGIDGAYRGVLGSTYDTLKNAESNQSKGTLSNREFVAQAVTKSGMKYNDIIGKAPKGQIAVVDNKTGEIGYIPVEEFSNNYTRL